MPCALVRDGAKIVPRFKSVPRSRNESGGYFDAIPKFVQDRYILQRATIFGAAGATITSRWVAWKIGLEAWQERFWFGYGMENFNYAFNRYYHPRLRMYDAGDFDRPHNRLVESVVTGGLGGIVAHLAVFATAGWFLLKKYWHNRSLPWGSPKHCGKRCEHPGRSGM